MKINQAIVIQDHTLGIVKKIYPNELVYVQILTSNPLRGSIRDPHAGAEMFHAPDCRPATAQDFQSFRLSAKGFEASLLP